MVDKNLTKSVEIQADTLLASILDSLAPIFVVYVLSTTFEAVMNSITPKEVNYGLTH